MEESEDDGDDAMQDVVLMNKAQSVVLNPEEQKFETKKLKAKKDLETLPQDMLCRVCKAARKSVMIVTCKHLVYCLKCDEKLRSKN